MKNLILVTLTFIITFLVIYGEWRSFYCLENGKCITVWKTFNKVCYIIPGKYYSPFKPSANYLKCATYNNLSLYFSDELPNSIVYKSFEAIEVKNDNRENIIFYDYNSNEAKFNSILYVSGAKKYDDVKPNAHFINIDILENMATGKNGEIQ